MSKQTMTFADLMDQQLSDNASKEMLHHMEKLKEAVLSNDADKVSEHAADIGNFAMKTWQDFGAWRN